MAAVNRRCLLLILLLVRRRRQRKRRPRRFWVRSIFQTRSTRGDFHSLISEMRLGDHYCFYRYFHMSPQRFNHLLSLVGPTITHQTTDFCKPISAGERLAITLWYLVTGDSMQTISFSYRIGHSTVCGIIDSTCHAIWNVLYQEYLRRPSSQKEWKQVNADFEQLFEPTSLSWSDWWQTYCSTSIW